MKLGALSIITKLKKKMTSLRQFYNDIFSSNFLHHKTDALKTEAHYCPNAPAGGYKNKVTCPKQDKGGVWVPVFTDRLCDNKIDCPDGSDEGLDKY